jgi:hypothetical protein
MWRERKGSAWPLKMAGMLLVMAASLILVFRREQSWFECHQSSGRCELERWTLFGGERQRMSIADIREVEVRIYPARRNSPQTILFVTASGKIPFSSRYGHPYARTLADQVRRFLGGTGAELQIAYDSFWDFFPIAGTVGTIGLIMFMGAMLWDWLEKEAKRPGSGVMRIR